MHSPAIVGLILTYYSGSHTVWVGISTEGMFFPGGGEMRVSGDDLTDRQREVLLRICTGECNREIAEDLKISMSTVKKHVYNTYRKLGVNNRFQATLWTAKYL